MRQVLSVVKPDKTDRRGIVAGKTPKSRKIGENGRFSGPKMPEKAGRRCGYSDPGFLGVANFYGDPAQAFGLASDRPPRVGLGVEAPLDGARLGPVRASIAHNRQKSLCYQRIEPPIAGSYPKMSPLWGGSSSTISASGTPSRNRCCWARSSASLAAISSAVMSSGAFSAASALRPMV